ncbi:D-inositol-3-phosphate glycosyltransferase [Neolewinella maritima]|uniref:D-inositol-3-phosphate glycosyltransferase n=1 Tax=Neolewinella maritima TaxID=1383882 RepID=A0ABM9B471_9BACT|nr:glycosyltransferase [Neolewinella maritima]CAH1002131.1 D-inositol-3-phosphate glycosyltransferase [Neolewinella maritima]
MNILHITAWWPSRMHPHHGNFIQKHVRLVARDHEVVVATVQEDQNLAYGKQERFQSFEDGYRVVQVYYGRPPHTNQLANLWSRARAYRQAMSIARRYLGKPDLIHSHIVVDGGILGGLLALRWGVPFVISEHATRYLMPTKLPLLKARLARWVCRRARFVLPVSVALREGMRTYGLRANYRVISNVVDTELFRPLPAAVARETFTFLHVSNFREGHKNISGLLSSFARVVAQTDRAVHLHLAGDGDVASVRQQVRSCGLHDVCTVSGPHTEVGIARHMQHAQAFVLFSNYETQGVVLMEALASGLPCITTKVGGAAEIIQDGVNGYTVAAGDVEGLSQAMIALLRHPERFVPATLREQAVTQYSTEAVRRQLAAVYSTTQTDR